MINWLKRAAEAISVMFAAIFGNFHLLKGIKMTLDELKTQVEANTAVEASAVLLIQGIAAQLAEVSQYPAKVQALADQLKTSADALAVAVTANTPAG
jgi:hypothetical protein